MNKAINALTLCALSLVHVRTLAQKGPDVSINSGLQTTTLINKEDQAAGPELNFKQKTGIPIGIGIGYTFSKRLGVGLNVIHVSNGQMYTGQVKQTNDPKNFLNQIDMMAVASNIPLTGTNYTARVKLSCTEIPILLRYTGNPEKKVYFNSFAGPQIVLVNSVHLFVNDKDAPVAARDIQPKTAYKKVLIDAVLGIGAGFNLSDKLSLTANLRLDYGLGDVENKNAEFVIGSGSTAFTQKYYAQGRSANHSASGGLMIECRYKFVKKAPVKIKRKVK